MGGAAEVEIRSLVPADLSDVGAIFRAHTGREADLELIRGWLDEAPGAVAVDVGEVVGFAFSKRFAPDVAEVANLLVVPTHRGRGVGAALLAAVEETAGRLGYRAAILVQSSLYRTVGPSADGPADHGGGAGPGSIYARHGYRDVLSTGPTVVWVKTLDGG